MEMFFVAMLANSENCKCSLLTEMTVLGNMIKASCF